MTDSQRLTIQCPPWCDRTHPHDPEGVVHASVLVSIPVRQDSPTGPDRIEIRLEQYGWADGDEPLEDELDQGSVTVRLALARAAGDQELNRSVVLADVPVTFDQLATLSADLRAAVAAPGLARLALAEILGARQPGGHTPTLEQWRQHQVAGGYSRATIEAQVGAVQRIATAAGVLPEHLTTEHVVAYLASRPLKPWSRLKYLQHVSAWASFAQIPDPTDGIHRPRTPRGTPRPITDDDLEQILAHASGRARLEVMLGAYAGFRSFETAKVCIEDLEPAGTGQWRLHVLGKAGREDVIPCHPVLAAELRSWAKTNNITRGPLFPGLRTWTVHGDMRALAAASGIPFTSHQLRHWFGTEVHRASGDLLTTQQLMRHASPQTTAGYAAVSGVRTRAIVDGLRVPSPTTAAG